VGTWKNHCLEKVNVFFKIDTIS